MNIVHNQKGFTLLEMVVYIGLVVIVAGLVINFALSLITSYGKTQASKEAMNNASFALDTIVNEIRQASKIYSPTSVFAPTDPGQLSLETLLNPPANETSTYVDFYVDNNKLYLKRESQSALALTSDRVKVKNLTFTRLTPPNAPESVKVQITVGYNAPAGSSFDISTTLNATASLR
jgi:type II secretory pathway pseudopilin PulG